MSPRVTKAWTRGAALLLAVTFSASGCDRISQFTEQGERPPPNVKGAPMEPMPTTTQQAQDAVYRYYVKTLQALPDGYALDNSRYGGSSVTVIPCSDHGSLNNHNDPARYTDARTILTPPGTNNLDLVAKIGDIWKNWGWRVEKDREGFNKPNRFATAPDGYELQVESDAQYPVMLKGSSPCFKGDKTRGDFIPSPTIITRDGEQYQAQKPVTTPGVSETPSKAFNW
ncbi:hypothetical protein Srot_1321 [Segniliparus rotundus DSM 44985]|uniref:Lipoprotein n=2 Tax=Segniliparus rotundus TaxID=286802 RepID=D6ZFR5_SEGRD|nr:hypothetical protein Srot_1321 [Segniliparus rotundus DSM 44985]